MADPVIMVRTKSTAFIVAEGLMYFIIGAVAPVVPILASDIALDNRSILLMVLTGLGGGAANLKAFFSSAFSTEPQTKHQT